MTQQFDNVTVVKQANVYFSGKVTSRTVLFADGSKKTLGYMQPGDYSFGTDAAELMEILGGELEVQLPGSEKWLRVAEGESFEVPAQSRFALRVGDSGADYCCSYLS